MNFEELLTTQLAEFISTYGTTIMYTILSAAVTALGTWVARIYNQKVKDETKRKIVKTCCKAVEQLYRDLDGPAKYMKACEAIEEMLAKQGITITALEIEMLIEEVCYDFKHSLDQGITNGILLEGTVEEFEGNDVNG